MRGWAGREAGPQMSEAPCSGRKGGKAQGCQRENKALALRNRKGRGRGTHKGGEVVMATWRHQILGRVEQPQGWEAQAISISDQK